MKISISELFEKVAKEPKSSTPLKSVSSNITEEEAQEMRTKLLVYDLAIDTRYVSITRRDVENFQFGNMKRYWKGSNQLGRKLLSFDPEKNSMGFYLYGPPGLGKTSMLKALAISLARKFKEQVKFTQMKDAIDAMIQDDFAYKAEISKKLIEAKFLFIDDLGIERSSEWNREQIYTVIDQRLYAHASDGEKKFTFFSSNLTLLEFQKRYHGRDVRRIRELAEFAEVR